MAKTTLLNFQLHKDLRIRTQRTHALGDGVMWCPTFASEFRSVQAHYPILFQEDAATHELFPVALFGLEQGENLFLTDSGWSAGYIPAMMQRTPFSIGLYPSDEEGRDNRRMMHIDVQHPRVNDTEGERLFGDDGAETPFLKRASGMLETIHVWSQHNKDFMAVLSELELVESVALDVTSRTGDKGQLIGFYTINEERLASFDANVVSTLHARGFLEPIYMVMASLSNVRKLAELK